MKHSLLEKMEGALGRTVEGQALAQDIREDWWAGGGPHAGDAADPANTRDTVERRRSKAMQCGMVRYTRGGTTIHVMGVVHGTKGSVHHRGQMEDIWECGCVCNIACGRWASCQWERRRETDV